MSRNGETLVSILLAAFSIAGMGGIEYMRHHNPETMQQALSRQGLHGIHTQAARHFDGFWNCPRYSIKTRFDALDEQDKPVSGYACKLYSTTSVHFDK